MKIGTKQKHLHKNMNNQRSPLKNLLLL